MQKFLLASYAPCVCNALPPVDLSLSASTITKLYSYQFYGIIATDFLINFQSGNLAMYVASYFHFVCMPSSYQLLSVYICMTVL